VLYVPYRKHWLCFKKSPCVQEVTQCVLLDLYVSYTIIGYGKISLSIFWSVTQCGLAGRSRFGGTYRLHLTPKCIYLQAPTSSLPRKPTSTALKPREPQILYEKLHYKLRSRGSSGSIVSGYGLDDWAIEVRSSAGAEDLSSSLCVQTDSGAPPSLLYNGYRGFFPRG
jgi:hypothetical protein